MPQHTFTPNAPKIVNWPMIILIGFGVIIILGIAFMLLFNKSDIRENTGIDRSSGVGSQSQFPGFGTGENQNIFSETDNLGNSNLNNNAQENEENETTNETATNNTDTNKTNTPLIYYRCNEEGTGIVQVTGNVLKSTGYATSGTFTSKSFSSSKICVPQGFPLSGDPALDNQFTVCPYPPVSGCVADGGIDDSWGGYICCSYEAIGGSTLCPNQENWTWSKIGNAGPYCTHICGTAGVTLREYPYGPTGPPCPPKTKWNGSYGIGVCRDPATGAVISDITKPVIILSHKISDVLPYYGPLGAGSNVNVTITMNATDTSGIKDFTFSYGSCSTLPCTVNITYIRTDRINYQPGRVPYYGYAVDNSLNENGESVEGWYEILLPEPQPEPKITATINPTSNITEITPVTLSANISANGYMFRRIQLIVDNSVVRECKSNTSVNNCSVTTRFGPAGLNEDINHTYWVLAYDAFGYFYEPEPILFTVKACPNYYQSNQTCFYTNNTNYINNYCGDGTCNNGETSISCQKDCKVEPNKINFSAVPSKILKGQDVTLSWTATGNALSCMGSVGWTGTKAKNGAEILKPSQTTIYVLTCGDKSETECVTVNTSV